jgi:hypothetical protein
MVILSGIAIMALVALSAGVLAADGPYLNVTSPPEDHFTNDATLVVNGTTEPDLAVLVRVDWAGGQAWNNTMADANGTFEAWVDLVEGFQNVTVEAVAGVANTTSVTREVVLDVTPPVISVRWEYLNGTGVPWNDERDGYWVNVHEVVIHGHVSDDHGIDPTYGVNGVWRFIFPGGWWTYTIFDRIALGEGINTVIIEVDDWAGNRATVRLYIYRDSFPPPLYVHSPLDNEMTNNATVVVAGLTEPYVRVDVVVHASAGTREYDLTSRTDGTFQIDVRLFEGIQEVLVTSTDWIGNANVTDLTLVLDTTPPHFEVLSPKDDPTYTNHPTLPIVGQMICECIARLHVNGVFLEEIGGMFKIHVPLKEGENIISIRAVDNVGNYHEVVLTVYLDIVPPGLTVTEPSVDPLYTNDTRIHLAGTATGSAGVTIEIDYRDYDAVRTSGTWEDGEWGFDLDLQPVDGEQTVVVRAVDDAGNEVNRSFLVVLDTAAPVLLVNLYNGFTETRSFIVLGNTSEDVVQVTLNGVEVAFEDGVIDDLVLLDEPFTEVRVEARDAAGNMATDTFTMQSPEAPDPYTELRYPKSTDKGRATVRGAVTDDVAEVWIDSRRVTVEDNRFEHVVELPKDGKNSIDIVFVDRAGNRATETIRIDKEAETPGFGAVVAAVAACLAVAVASRKRR